MDVFYYKNLLFGPVAAFGGILTILLLAWSLVWKGLALWRAARNCQKYWYIVLLVVNSVGILEILYLVFFQKKRECKESKFLLAKKR